METLALRLRGVGETRWQTQTMSAGVTHSYVQDTLGHAAQAALRRGLALRPADMPPAANALGGGRTPTSAAAAAAHATQAPASPAFPTHGAVVAAAAAAAHPALAPAGPAVPTHGAVVAAAPSAAASAAAAVAAAVAADAAAAMAQMPRSRCHPSDATPARRHCAQQKAPASAPPMLAATWAPRETSGTRTASCRPPESTPGCQALS
mmetsp:Transcript_112240/g.317235  ORF Transcript_112240/g.317235 Transcript_112240/m.317235 type:complete len:207 (-) Transcript_112240:123-743(-)